MFYPVTNNTLQLYYLNLVEDLIDETEFLQTHFVENHGAIVIENIDDLNDVIHPCNLILIAHGRNEDIGLYSSADENAIPVITRDDLVNQFNAADFHSDQNTTIFACVCFGAALGSSTTNDRVIWAPRTFEPEYVNDFIEFVENNLI
uniref:Uncharacterized protein n=1 Tax=Chromulina nebulosa TaxID=96789 RepID=A0A7S0ST12_9STRA|mmetsp:Transcript_3198/g.2849  ORF Transcript_3198/g.2849 Transcript_3198/m.2849 type:complete len:147 (+) Transcript_3198:38-478(+)